ncbi:MAG: hypothetical protein RR779_03660 [Comamonas sp.]
MLSKYTLKLLDELCAKSKDQYSEGGILWTFVEAANQAHFRFKDSRREPQAGAMDVKQLGAWVQGALGGASNPQELVAAVSTSIANELLRALKDDLQVDDFLWAFEDGGTEMTGNIYMARNFDNRYFALEMWWSID